ncbi:hypothetical protein REC12_17820 [Desulfosporosinus sp. PR]|uniref:DUF7713 domain-containing protein n=1 Tax=Candidatus Desulfosporosinus nitrosoreducens TaxID=3401928 RepID=UPI0027F9E4F6|nr:hypothetical protein [Desulfosporosinus sp. PR]MDQ7095451.1 hypothetical protein [Desulfosporosinus sp. PR]
MKKCHKCKSNEASIHDAEIGDFCLDCHNEYMAELLGVSITNNFSKIVSFNDAERIVHQFEISNMIMPGFSVWKAEEIDGGYQFEILLKPEENQVWAIEQLHQKILTGLGYKTLSRRLDSNFIDNAIHLKNEQYSLKSVGTCRIQYSKRENICLIVDGKRISLDDFGRALTAFEGFNLDFQIRDLSDEVLGKDTVLHRVSINSNVIMERFERTLGWFLEHNFLSYKHKSACEEALFERIDELELLCKYGSRDDAEDVGRKMKRRLAAIDNDTDDFPNYLVEMIDQVIGKKS